MARRKFSERRNEVSEIDESYKRVTDSRIHEDLTSQLRLRWTRVRTGTCINLILKLLWQSNKRTERSTAEWFEGCLQKTRTSRTRISDLGDLLLRSTYLTSTKIGIQLLKMCPTQGTVLTVFPPETTNIHWLLRPSMCERRVSPHMNTRSAHSPLTERYFTTETLPDWLTKANDEWCQVQPKSPPTNRCLNQNQNFIIKWWKRNLKDSWKLTS